MKTDDQNVIKELDLKVFLWEGEVSRVGKEEIPNLGDKTI